MADLVANTNRVQIPITDDSTWRTLRLDSGGVDVLTNADAKIIVVVFKNTINAIKSCGIRHGPNPSQSAQGGAQVVSLGIATAVATLDDDNQIEYNCDPGVEIYIQAEWCGDNVKKVLSDQIANSTVNIWADNTNHNWISGYPAGDAGNVGSVICFMRTGNVGQVGIQKRLPSFDDIHPARSNRQSWGVAETVIVGSADTFESYRSQSGGKSPAITSWVYIVGYTLSTSSFVNQTVGETGDEGVSTIGAFTAYDAGKTANTEIAAVARLRNAGGNQAGYVKHPDSTDTQNIIGGADILTFAVGLNGSEELEYYITADTMDLYIEGTLEEAVADGGTTVNIDSGEVNIDTGIINLGG